MSKNQTSPKPETSPPPMDGERLSAPICSASIGPGQKLAPEIWAKFKDKNLEYIDMLELCSCLICNVADKTKSTDQEIAVMTFKLVKNMRSKLSKQNSNIR